MKKDTKLVAKLSQLEKGGAILGANGHGIRKTGDNTYRLVGGMLGGDGGKRQMPSMSVSGGSHSGGSVSGGSAKQKAKAKSNPWIKHVKAYAKQHNISYGDAISKAKASYKK